MHNRSAKFITTTALSLAIAASPFAASAQDTTTVADNSAAVAASPQRVDVLQQVDQAQGVIHQMQKDPDLAGLMDKAKGIFVVPDFGRAAAVVGVRGGTGMLITNDSGAWSSPAFYNMGGVSVGAQIGASGGSIAFLLMDQKAVDQFMEQNSFSLNADAGLSIINYSANAQASWGKGDIIMWSDTEGAFAGVQISATDIMWDGEANRAYYGKKVAPSDILMNAQADTNVDTLDDAFAS